MDESRKQFEEAFEEITGWEFADYPAKAQADEYWDFWQASRAAIEINLPAKTESSLYEHYMPYFTMDADSVENAIRAAGIKVKE